MGGKGSFFIMLLIVAFLSLALAVMAGLFFFTSNPEKKEETVEKKEVKAPKESDLMEMRIESKPFNLRNSIENDGISYIQISATIKYFKAIEDVEGLNTEEKMTLNQSAIMEIFSKYFLSRDLEEIRAEDAIDKTKKALIKQINDYLVANEKYKVEIVYTINFSEWLYQ